MNFIFYCSKSLTDKTDRQPVYIIHSACITQMFGQLPCNMFTINDNNVMLFEKLALHIYVQVSPLKLREESKSKCSIFVVCYLSASPSFHKQIYPCKHN